MAVARPYRVVVPEADPGYKCICPSRKFRCKHTLALIWMRADSKPFARADRHERAAGREIPLVRG